jgi:hypothetical protein
MREFSCGTCEPRYRQAVAQSWPKLPTTTCGQNFNCTAEVSGFPAGSAASLSLIGIGVMYGKLMLPDVLLPKLLDGYPATFERSEGLNDFVVRVNGADRTISREAWRSLLDHTRSPVDQPRVTA